MDINSIKGYDYGYGELENKLINLFLSGPPDFTTASRLIAAGADVNALPKGSTLGGNVLAEIIFFYRQVGNPLYLDNDEVNLPLGFDGGEAIISIIRFFLEHGFDVEKCSGRFGAQCLETVPMSNVGEHVFEAIKLLVAAGAKNTIISDDNNRRPWERISDEGGMYFLAGNDHIANYYEAAYQIFQAIEDGRPYERIDVYDRICGDTIKCVLATRSENKEVFFDLDLPDSRHKNCYTSTLYFVCQDNILVATKYIDLWVDGFIQRTKMTDVSNRFAEIIGTQICSIKLSHDRTIPSHGRPVAEIRLSNGKHITMMTNFGETDTEHTTAYYQICE